jgi:hypothetical protein
MLKLNHTLAGQAVPAQQREFSASRVVEDLLDDGISDGHDRRVLPADDESGEINREPDDQRLSAGHQEATYES